MIGRYPNDVGLRGLLETALQCFRAEGDTHARPITDEELDAVIDVLVEETQARLGLDADGYRSCREELCDGRGLLPADDHPCGGVRPCPCTTEPR